MRGAPKTGRRPDLKDRESKEQEQQQIEKTCAHPPTPLAKLTPPPPRTFLSAPSPNTSFHPAAPPELRRKRCRGKPIGQNNIVVEPIRGPFRFRRQNWSPKMTSKIRGWIHMGFGCRSTLNFRISSMFLSEGGAAEVGISRVAFKQWDMVKRVLQRVGSFFSHFLAL